MMKLQRLLYYTMRYNELNNDEKSNIVCVESEADSQLEHDEKSYLLFDLF